MWKPPQRIKHSLPVVRFPTEEEARASMLFSPLDIGTKARLEERTWVPAIARSWSRQRASATFRADRYFASATTGSFLGFRSSSKP